MNNSDSAVPTGYSPKEFWTDRCLRYGHTGELDAQLYAYDQPQRLRAIDKALKRANVPIGADTTILDVGCGAGDMIASLLRYGRPLITGIDISEDVVRTARQRFAAEATVTLLAAHAEDMAVPAGAFDVAFGINVLQHIPGNAEFRQAIVNICRAVKAGGHIVVMDFSPITVKNRTAVSYIVFRSRQEYVDAFAVQGCRLVCECGLPRIGVRLYQTLNRCLALVRRPPAGAEAAVPAGGPGPARPSRHMARTLRAALLRLALPFDLFLTPFPARFTDMRILVFQTTAPHRNA